MVRQAAVADAGTQPLGEEWVCGEELVVNSKFLKP